VKIFDGLCCADTLIDLGTISRMSLFWALSRFFPVLSGKFREA
jgi:hypothetical protein